MYASQTKRLCVREDPSEETRSQQHSSSSTENTTESSTQQQRIHSSTNSKPSSTDQLNNQYQSNSINPVAQRGIKRASATEDPVGGVGTIGPEPFGFSASPATTSANMTASATDNITTDARDENKSPNMTPKSGPVIKQQQQNAVPDVTNDEVTNLKHTEGQTEQDLIAKLANEVLEEVKLEIILSIRNLITACNKKKLSLVKNPDFSEILRLLDENSSSTQLKAELALLICSIAKGGEENVRLLNGLHINKRIFNLILSSSEDRLVESCLRCLRSIMQWPSISQYWLIYNEHIDESQEDSDGCVSSVASKMINLARTSRSLIVKECVSDIFATTCCRPKEQTLLMKSGALSCIMELVESSANRVILSALNWLSSLCLKNNSNSDEATKIICPTGVSLIDRLIDLMSKDRCYELQYQSAKCFTQIYRAVMSDDTGYETRIISHVLPTLVRLVQPDIPSKLRAESAECIAYLIECDTKLQETASICDHLIESLANMLDQDSNTTFYDLKEHYFQHFTSANHRYLMERDSSVSIIDYRSRQQVSPLILDLRSSVQINHEASKVASEPTKETNNPIEYSQEMKQAAFLALAALGSNLEPIRKKIFDTCAVMQHLIRGLSDSEDPNNLKPVLTCLLSLSRSVQQLRTSFAENSVYSQLKGLMSTQSKDILLMVLAILCNISLDFSPTKQHFLDNTTISSLCSFARSRDPFLKLHAMWILMNMIYQLKDQNQKFNILRTLGIDHIQNILENDNYEDLVLKTLGFLRNLLSQKSHIDAIMSNYGDQIMQSLARLLDRPFSNRIREQAMCVLTNIADGSESKAQIMSNPNILAHIAKVMCDERSGDTRLAAICCVTNLAHRDGLGSYERRDEMRKYGIEAKLKAMLNSNDPILSDRARTAYNQFMFVNMGIEDKCEN